MDELLSQLHKAEERYIFLQKQIIQLQAKLDIAVEALGWCNSLGKGTAVSDIASLALKKLEEK